MDRSNGVLLPCFVDSPAGDAHSLALKPSFECKAIADEDKGDPAKCAYSHQCLYVCMRTCMPLGWRVTQAKWQRDVQIIECKRCVAQIS